MQLQLLGILLRIERINHITKQLIEMFDCIFTVTLSSILMVFT